MLFWSVKVYHGFLIDTPPSANKTSTQRYYSRVLYRLSMKCCTLEFVSATHAQINTPSNSSPPSTQGTHTYSIVSSRDFVITNMLKTNHFSPNIRIILHNIFGRLSSCACTGIGFSVSLSKAAGTLVVGLWTDISEFVNRNHEELLKVRCSSFWFHEAEVLPCEAASCHSDGLCSGYCHPTTLVSC